MQYRDMSSDFKVQLARSSCIIPIISIIIWVFRIPAEFLFQAQIIPVLLDEIVLLFFVIGTMLGGIGLFLVKRSNAKSMLPPLILGLLMNVGFLCLYFQLHSGKA